MLEQEQIPCFQNPESVLWPSGRFEEGTPSQSNQDKRWPRRRRLWRGEADLSGVMPFDFTKLIWIALLAYLLFGEVPAWTTWGGGVLIFASGVFIARREAFRRVQGI